MNRSAKPFVLRMNGEERQKLDLIAEVLGVTPTDLVRESLHLVIQKHLNDPNFKQKAQERAEARRQEAERMLAAVDEATPC